jgi:hypothetical protein
VAYLGISEKTFVKKMNRNVFPENAPSLRFHVSSFPCLGIHGSVLGQVINFETPCVMEKERDEMRKYN